MITRWNFFCRNCGTLTTFVVGSGFDSEDSRGICSPCRDKAEQRQLLDEMQLLSEDPAAGY